MIEFLVGTLLEIKVPKGCVHSNIIEEPFWSHKDPFSAQFLKDPIFLSVNYFLVM